MIKIEDFKNAPVGATATHPGGARAMKIDDGEQYWITPTGLHVSNEHVWGLAYTLDQPDATTTREALDLAWVLAHEVKPGQAIPKGARFMEFSNSGLREYTALSDFKLDPERAPITRTVEPLPEPEPEWLDAPAVIAHVDAPNVQPTSVFVPTGTHPDRWARFDSEWTFHWNELRNVIPLYPREGQNS